MEVVKGTASELFKSRFILSQMVKKNIKSQYRNSVLGILWTILNPLLNMIVLAVIFSTIFGRNIEHYHVYLLTGNMVFSFMRMSTERSLTCMEANRGLLTKVKIPYFIFPVSHVLGALVNFFFSFIALFFVMLIMGTPIQVSILMVVPFLPSLIMFVLGMSLILATMYVFFKDTKHLYSVFLTLWTYCTPLFYSVTDLPHLIQSVMQFNPMYHYVTYFREIVISGTVPSLLTHWICYGIGIEFLLIGILIFNWKSKKFILHI